MTNAEKVNKAVEKNNVLRNAIQHGLWRGKEYGLGELDTVICIETAIQQAFDLRIKK
jgi:hypothetical protein